MTLKAFQEFSCYSSFSGRIITVNNGFLREPFVHKNPHIRCAGRLTTWLVENLQRRLVGPGIVMVDNIEPHQVNQGSQECATLEDPATHSGPGDVNVKPAPHVGLAVQR